MPDPEPARTRRAIGALAGCVLAWSAATVHAQEAPEFPDDPSAFTEVIDAREYDDQAESVGDVLDKVAGVRTRRYGGLGAFSTASIRGSKSEQVLVLLDGVRLNSGRRSSVDLSTIPLRLVERIEVVRGGGAARYGSDAVGGVISITTRSGEGADGIDWSGTAGRYGTLGADAVASWSRDRLSALVGYSRLRSDNDFSFDRVARDLGAGGLCIACIFNPTFGVGRHTRVNADFVEDSALGRISFARTRTSEVEATLDLERRDGGQPGGNTNAPLGSPDDRVSCASSEEKFRRAVARVGLRERDFAGGAVHASVFYRYEKNDLHDPRGLCGFVDPKSRNGLDRVESIDTQGGGEVEWVGRRLDLGPATLLTRSSFGLRQDGFRSDEAEHAGRWTANGFLQAELRLWEGLVRVIPAIGVEDTTSEEVTVREPGLGAPVESKPADGTEWLPRIGLIVEPTSGVRIKSNYARAYRRPSFAELYTPDTGVIRGNPNLRPEEAWNFDVGLELRGAPTDYVQALRLEAVYFHRDLDETIEWTQLNAFAVAPLNLGAARARGYELSASALIGGRLDLSASYTYLDSEIRGTGNQLPHSPRNQLFVGAGLDVGPARLFGELRYEDEFNLNQAGLTSLDEVTQIDLGVAVELARLLGLGFLPPGLRLSSEWVNVTDAERIDSLGQPLPGALWYLRLRGTFR